jgi:radical SAM protein with 4Fe4S-binding SPASM domain
MFSLRFIYRIVVDYAYAFSVKRVVNLIKVVSSMAVTRLTGRVTVWGLPPILMVEPTNACNLRCPLCPSGAGTLTRPRGQMGLEAFTQIIDEVGETLCLIILWNQGEPLLHKSFVEMVRYAKRYKIPVMTSTNGHPLSWDSVAEAVVASGIDEVIVALDGVRQETYEVYRQGGKVDVVIEGIRRLTAAKRHLGSRKPTVNLQFIVMRHNQGEIEEMRQLAKDLGVDKLTMKSVQVGTVEEATTFLPDDPHYRRYDFSGDHLRTKGGDRFLCSRLWRGTVINWDGTVSPCCFDKDGEHVLGEVGQDGGGLRSIWKSGRYRTFRDRVLKGRNRIGMCRNCTEGVKDVFPTVEVLK